MSNQEQQISIAEITRKTRNGDSLTDAEVIAGSKFYAKLALDLAMSGPEFYCAFIAASRFDNTLRSYAHARGLETVCVFD